MNLKRGFRRITLILAILVGIICGATAIVVLINKRSSALRHLDKCEKQFIESIPVADPNERPPGWMEWSEERHTALSDWLEELSTSLFIGHLYWHERLGKEEAAKLMHKYGSCIEKAGLLMAAYRNDRARLSTSQFIGLLVLTGLGCVIAGICGVWLVYKLIKWLVLGFCGHTA